MDGAGRAVVLWTDANQEPSSLIHPRIASQRFDPQGGRIASEFVCNDSEADAATGILMPGRGEFIALWAQGSGFQHYARHYLVPVQKSTISRERAAELMKIL
jgi:hypothetical protein